MYPINSQPYDASLIVTQAIPIKSDSRYKDWRAPVHYTKETSLPLEEGDLLVQAKIKPNSNNATDFSSWPSHFPVRMIAQASRQPDYIIMLNLFGNALRIKVIVEDCEESKPIGLISGYGRIRSCIVYPEKETSFPVDEYCQMTYMVEKAKSVKKENKVLFYSELFKNSQESWPLLTRKTIEETYLDPIRIGNGGQGIVFRVRLASTSAIRAVKISFLLDHNPVFPTLKYIQNQDLTPHLTRIEDFFKVERSESPFDTAHQGCLLTVHRTSPVSNGCYVMEYMEGDLSKLTDVEALQWKVFTIQQAATIQVLDQFRVSIGDYQTRNILYKKLDESDTYKGKRLIDFDFWKYTIEEHAFYVPRPNYLIKFADYDSWAVEMFSGKKKSRYPAWFEIPGMASSFHSFSKLFSKPAVEDNKIIEI